MLRKVAPQITWHSMLENVASMSQANRDLISLELGREHPQPKPYWVDAALVGPVSRPRLYWTDWEPQEGELAYKDSGQGYMHASNPSKRRIGAEEFLDPGMVQYCPEKPFPTAVRWVVRSKPPLEPAGIEGCDAETLDKWRESSYAMPPYQFKKELGVVDSEGKGERPPNAREREKLHGFKPGHTAAFPEHQRISFVGNSFHCIVVACLLASWAVQVGYLESVPTIDKLWNDAGYGNGPGPKPRRWNYVAGREEDEVDMLGELGGYRPMRFSAEFADPGVHEVDLGEDRITVVTQPELECRDDVAATEEHVMHLVQDEETVAELHHCVLPPDEYYEELAEKWKVWWPKANPLLLET
jgi:hypothetical protein